ncbi:MAG TPA: FAD-binding oxidoreductase [Stellaceae bacterium]|jgi:D-amino-acid dehydrogenase|nr:FAD-binding oxidoreductase [Stellaceae bacterium]
MTADPSSIAIVGAGIVGMSAALYLSRAGLPVRVIDPLPPGGGASYGNAGLISVESCVPIALPGMLREVPRWLTDPLAPLAVRPSYLPQALPWLRRWIAAGRLPRVEAAAAALRALHVDALDRYRELLGVEFDNIIRVSGQVHTWESAEPSPSEAIYRRLWETHGVVAEWLSADELRQLVPELARDVTRAVFLPKNGHTLNPRRLVTTLARLFIEAGGTVLAERVLKLLPEGSGWRVVTSTANHIVGKVVVSAGAWSAQLLRPLGIKLPLETERGYHMMLRDASVVPRVPILSRGRGFSITPMEEGLRLAGTVEIGGLALPMNEARAYALLRQAKAVLPGLETSDFSIWMGFRPSFPDSLPVIDAAPGRRGLFLAFGHGHTGMTGGAPTGRLVKQLVVGEMPDLPLAAYSARRFY